MISVFKMFCAVCVSEFLHSKQEWEMDVRPIQEKESERPEFQEVVREAITMAPSWQQIQVMGQIIMACVPLPTCEYHLTNREKTTEERAMESGLAIPGRM